VGVQLGSSTVEVNEHVRDLSVERSSPCATDDTTKAHLKSHVARRPVSEEGDSVQDSTQRGRSRSVAPSSINRTSRVEDHIFIFAARDIALDNLSCSLLDVVSNESSVELVLPAMQR